MSPAAPKTLDATFHALAHPARRAMLATLADGVERTVGELAAPFDVSLAASSKHLKVLEAAGLIRRRVVGRTHAVRIDASPLAAVADWTEEFRAHWEATFQRLDDVLDELKRARPRTRRTSPTSPRNRRRER